MPRYSRILPEDWYTQRYYNDRFCYDQDQNRFLYRRSATLYLIRPSEIGVIAQETTDELTRSPLLVGYAMDPSAIQWAQVFRQKIRDREETLPVVSPRCLSSTWNAIRRRTIAGDPWQDLIDRPDSSDLTWNSAVTANTAAQALRDLRINWPTQRPITPQRPAEVPPGVEWEAPNEVARATPVGRGSCIDRQTSISCPAGCPCGNGRDGF